MRNLRGVQKHSKIFVAGHRGMVGSAIVRRLKAEGCERVVTRTRAEVDLTNQAAVARFFAEEKPEYVFLAAAKAGGILANNTRPAEFIRDNLLIEANVIDAAWRNGVTKLLYLGSSCVYPKFAEQPIREQSLLTGALEPTNEPYAVAKIAGIVMAQSYTRQYGMRAISLLPTNLYGPGDNFDLESSHVLPAMIRKFHEARVSAAPFVTLWGSGTPRREFLHVDDLAGASVFLMRHYEDPAVINVGVGEDVAIAELAEIVRETVGYTGEIRYDRTKPDGTPRKLMDVGKLRGLGWQAKRGLRDGIADTYRWYTARA
ncbi:MAG: GDP-L-fucose synthase [Acidobacteria bacterium]|nr:GDP-L-fucose synthase [Acidobacteriota bacterium]